jgi:prolyl-tRNA synthetase
MYMLNLLKISWLYPVKKDQQKQSCFAEETYCIEALMQDGKALQAGTSHFGQNFAKPLMLSLNAEGKQEYVWGTSWVFQRV